jgi:hypothetical protein
MVEETAERMEAVLDADEADDIESTNALMVEVAKSDTPDAGAAAVLAIRPENENGTAMRTRQKI